MDDQTVATKLARIAEGLPAEHEDLKVVLEALSARFDNTPIETLTIAGLMAARDELSIEGFKLETDEVDEIIAGLGTGVG